MRSQQTVFIVDDDSSVRKSLCALAASKGVKSSGYRSAEEFLQSGDYRSDGCVVADVRMTGMSGFELHAQLQREGISMPMIVITGFADSLEEGISEADRSGVRLLEKTCSSEELWDAIRESLGLC